MTIANGRKHTRMGALPHGVIDGLLLLPLRLGLQLQAAQAHRRHHHRH